uniref:Uncharacterized protein n=1 Tax=Romanomermis culicivorax TaxID=13658 RepID=A0A915JMQ8_ROMCU
MHSLWIILIVGILFVDDVIGSYQSQNSFKLANFIKRRKLDHCSNVLCGAEEDCCIGYNCVKNNLVENLGLCLKSGNNFCMINNDGETALNPNQCPEGKLCVPFQETLRPLGFCADELLDLLPKRRYCNRTLRNHCRLRHQQETMLPTIPTSEKLQSKTMLIL